MKATRKHLLLHCGTINLFVYVFIIFQVGVSCLRLSELRIPNHILRGNTARLECLYELDQDESLYSVKWYKDGNEFYRYHPKENPPAKVLEIPGVSVELDNSSDTTVSLRKVPLAASGRYRCEVLGEAPSFHTVVDHGDMTVVALPEEGPRITGGRGRYQEGDMVQVTCISGPSSPAASLAWFINGDPADPSLLRGPKRKTTSGGLSTTTLGLEFKVKPEHFKHGDMKMKCLATIATVYWRSNEESVEGERPQRAPALESRDSSTAVDTRADRVQATTLNGCTLHKNYTPVTCIILLIAFIQKIMTDR